VTSKEGESGYEVPAALSGSRNLEGARKFLNYLGSDVSARVFEKYGLIVLK
jgi:hypothetical protein